MAPTIVVVLHILVIPLHTITYCCCVTILPIILSSLVVLIVIMNICTIKNDRNNIDKARLL